MNGIAFLPEKKVILSYGIHWKRAFPFVEMISREGFGSSEDSS